MNVENMRDIRTRASPNEQDGARVLLAGLDTVHLSADANVSTAVRVKLDVAKEAAQQADKENAVHCPDWLGAQVHPHGTRGGYGHLIETEDFTVKVLGANLPNRPGLYIELRSLFLHTHPAAASTACSASGSSRPLRASAWSCVAAASGVWAGRWGLRSVSA